MEELVAHQEQTQHTGEESVESIQSTEAEEDTNQVKSFLVYS